MAPDSRAGVFELAVPLLCQDLQWPKGPDGGNVFD